MWEDLIGGSKGGGGEWVEERWEFPLARGSGCEVAIYQWLNSCKVGELGTFKCIYDTRPSLVTRSFLYSRLTPRWCWSMTARYGVLRRWLSTV